MNRSEYDSIEGLNWSTLKLMENTPARARHLFDHPDEIKDKVVKNWTKLGLEGEPELKRIFRKEG